MARQPLMTPLQLREFITPYNPVEAAAEAPKQFVLPPTGLKMGTV
jgi:hypothetical protein